MSIEGNMGDLDDVIKSALDSIEDIQTEWDDYVKGDILELQARIAELEVENEELGDKNTNLEKQLARFE